MTQLPPFQRVFDLHGPALLRFCLVQAGAERGEDVFQETMLAALAAYPQLRDPAAVRAWLFAIAARKAVDAHRGAVAAPQPSDVIERLAGEDHATAAPEPADEALRARVRALPPKQRTALLLRVVAGLPHAEVAAAMEISVEAARRNVHEALTRLRAAPPAR